MSSIVIITARGGSKRIPRKNIKSFMGKPMVCYAIEAALGAGIFDEVMVSTDDAEIAEESRRAGARIPFLRSSVTSGDFATTCDVLMEVLAEYEKIGRTFEDVVCIYPCVPLLTASTLRDAMSRFLDSGARALMPVVRFSFPVQRAVVLNSEGFLEYREKENAVKRSQDLEPVFHDAGMFYFVKAEALVANKTLVPPGTIAFQLPEDTVQDIDNETDWKMAELKFRLNESARETGNG